jgi:hypothetical protein
VEALANQGDGEAIRRAGDELQAACLQLEREVCERRRVCDISADQTPSKEVNAATIAGC